MEDLTGRLNRLTRPRLLIDAARHAQAVYDRQRDLPPLLGEVPGPGPALIRLLELEAAQEGLRKTKARAYRARAHVGVMIALMGEATLFLEGLSRVSPRVCPRDRRDDTLT